MNVSACGGTVVLKYYHYNINGALYLCIRIIMQVWEIDLVFTAQK